MINKLFRNSRNLFIAGALLAVVAFVLAFSVLNTKTQQAQVITQAAQLAIARPAAVAPMLRAKVNIPALTQFTDPTTANKYFDETPVQGYVNPDYVKGQAGLAFLLTPAGGGARHAAFAIQKGQPLLISELVTYTAPGAVDYNTMLGKGQVAETVQAPPLSAVNGVVQPGDHVNLLLSVKLDLRLRDLLTGKHKFYTPTFEDITASTPVTKVVGYLFQSQTTIEDLKVLAVSMNNYTLALTNQQAVELKFIKDNVAATNAIYNLDLVVRASSDTDGAGKYFTTDSFTPDSLLAPKDPHANKFVLP